MSKTDYNSIYSGEYRSSSADLLKFWLMPFVMFVFFGFPTVIGGYVSTLSNFAAPAFFILSGFFILVPDDAERRAKLKNAAKRSLIFFSVVFAVYLLINIAYLSYMNYDWVPEIVRKRKIFEFLVFNVWPFPIGTSIWFIQSLLYANVIFLIADKLHLLKKAFIRIPVFIILVIIALFAGEFAKISDFPYFGYNYIPGGAVTRALPYMLIGMFIRKHANSILNIKRWIFPVLFAAGLLLAALELILLSRFKLLVYTGHMFGFSIMAISVCCFALSKTGSSDAFLPEHSRSYAKRIYALSQPVYFIVMFGLRIIAQEYFALIQAFGSIIIFAICLFIAYITGIIKFALIDMKKYDEE